MKTMSMLTYSQFQLCFNLTKPLNKEIKRSNISEMSFHLVSVPCLHEVQKPTQRYIARAPCSSSCVLSLCCRVQIQALLTFRRLRPLVQVFYIYLFLLIIWISQCKNIASLQVFYIYLFLLIIWISQLKTKKGKYSFVQLKTTEECASVSIKLSKQSSFCKPIKPAFQAHDKSKGEHSGSRSIKRK